MAQEENEATEAQAQKAEEQVDRHLSWGSVRIQELSALTTLRLHNCKQATWQRRDFMLAKHMLNVASSIARP